MWENDNESENRETDYTDLSLSDNQGIVEDDDDDDIISTANHNTYTPVSLEESDISSNDHLIYPHARISNAASMLLIMTFAITHQLSGSALRDLLSLIDIHCLKPHTLIQSLYKFKKYFEFLSNPIKRHHFCTKCCLPLDL